ncbi:pantothenate transporter [Kockovaella imperatae]|uniref:Pantothenate transporter n=1 Tax=Kockovaella imperatae TaxID=4999 RepID=A0A1Y1UJG9_9TREE|nr:pantothenate transporter [Kockovaella imperatae]ORX38210.1 pantothenate transporter [Kockovaella imperatae]
MNDKGEKVQLDTITPEEEKKVLRKIDLIVLPLFFLIYGFQYLDKIALSYAAIFGMKTDLHLVGQDYSWCASIFYFGQLASEFIAIKALHIFPIKLYVGVTVVAWGAIMMCNATPHDFGGLMVARFFLGLMEGSVAPAFVVLISHWYRKHEHPLRIAVFVTADAVAQIVGALLLFALGGVDSAAIAGWRISFLVAGTLTILIGGIFLLVVPVSPHAAWFLNEREKYVAVERVAREHASGQHSEWRWDQMYETLRDPLFYLIFTWAFCICATSVVSFGSIVINGFGFSPLKTVIVGLPGPAIQITTIWLAVLATRIWKGARGFIQTAFILPPLIGVIMLQTLPYERKWALTGGYWLATCNSSVFVINMSLISSNIKGHTRKSLCSSVYFIGYAVGCVVGPQLFISVEAPLYPTAMRTIAGLYVVFIIAQLTFMGLNWKENRRRDKLAAGGMERAIHRPAAGEDNETDKEDLGFRYVL